MTRARVRVTGRVQGVFFRAEARARAESLELGGWIRNAGDGSVDAVFEGEQERVESMIDWCRRGPPGAAVEQVDLRWEEPQGVAGFLVR